MITSLVATPQPVGHMHNASNRFPHNFEVNTLVFMHIEKDKSKNFFASRGIPKGGLRAHDPL